VTAVRAVTYARREIARLTVRRAVANPARPDDTAADDPTEICLDAGGLEHTLRVPAGVLPPMDPVHLAAIPSIPQPMSTGDRVDIARISVEVTDPRARSLDWEGWLAAGTGHLRAIRTVPVRPRVAGRPMVFPLRVRLIGGRAKPLEQVLDRLFGSGNHQTAFEIYYDDSPVWRPQVADIVHLSRFDNSPMASRPDRAARILARWTDSQGVRLLVVEDLHSLERPRWREIAQALAERGGPAVLLANDRLQHGALYGGLVHDEPLDRIVQELSAAGPAELVGGSGREDLVRISAIANALSDVAGWLEKLLPAEPATTGSPSAGHDPDIPDDLAPEIPELRRTVESARQDLLGLRFDRETTGTLPSSRTAHSLRRVWSTIRSVGRGLEKASEADPFAPVPRPAGPSHSETPLAGDGPQGSDGRRSVNARLLVSDRSGTDLAMDPRVGRLVPGRPVRLEIEISRPDLRLQRVGGAAFIEDAIAWDPDELETLLEIGVTGIDFAVLGSPTQELRLPRTGPSDTASFTIMPGAGNRIGGVARLRFCIYHRNNLIQSYRVVAVLEDAAAGQATTAAPPLRQTCALALGVGEDALPAEVQGGYFTRLEYGAFDCEDAGRAPERALSFFVNDNSGQSIVSCKGEDLFSGRVVGDLPEAIGGVRETLKAISEKQGEILPNSVVYAFSQPVTDERWSDALTQLAANGWELYSQLVPEALQDAVAEALSGAPQVIHAGHHDLEHVLPWGLLYMRPYDASRTMRDGVPVLRAACPAGMPAADGTPGAIRCGERPECLLHPSRVSAAPRGGPIPAPDTIACPLQFWGFRHVIEVPVQQVEARHASSQATALETKPPRPLAEQVKRAGPARVLVGYNAELALAKAHLAALEQRLGAAGAVMPFVPEPICKRDALLEALRKAGSGSQIIYFYSHAEPSLIVNGRRLLGPHLRIENFQDLRGRIAPANIVDFDLSGRPLVFLNGCGTAGFSPVAPSQFIVKFVACGAAAVIGTETTIWEQLAGEMSIAFLTRFLSGRSAGEALLGARRELLARRNPLGLVYTLYGAAHLTLAE
jgi:hypothetical protein